jgi:hypothetical protein
MLKADLLADSNDFILPNLFESLHYSAFCVDALATLYFNFSKFLSVM